MMTRSRPFEEYHEKQMRDPEYAAAYRALEPEFEIAEAIIRLRTEQGLSQQELAEKMHTGQPEYLAPGTRQQQSLFTFPPARR